MELSENTAVILAILVCAVFLFGGYAVWIMDIRPFLRRRNYLLSQLEKSADREEFEYWKNELKKNWQKRIPILGRKIREKEEL